MPYDKQTWVDGVAGGTPITADRLDHIEDGVDAATATADNLDPRVDALEADQIGLSDVVRLSGTQVGSSKGKDWRRIGPVTTDITSLVQTNTGDGSLTQQYLLGNSAAIPASHPMDFGLSTMKALTNAFGYAELQYPVLGGHIRSLMTDAPRVAIRFGYASASWAYQAWIDGAPVTLDPQLGNGQQFLIFDFPTSGRARLIEIMTRASTGSIYCAPPYRVWKPGAKPAPKIVVIGDSYAMTTSYDDAGASLPGEFGMYHRIRGDIGVVNLSVDGVGGSGFIQKNAGGVGGPDNNYADRLPSALALNPDVLIWHGCGANDMVVGGYSNAAIIAAATEQIQDARAALPDAKLVFLEGFAPPVGFSDKNDEYIAIRQGVQANCLTEGVYYVDVATTSPWLSGTGYYGFAGTGNTQIYVGPDGTHLTAKGSDYLRSRMADKLRTILADNGSLINQLI